MAAIDVGAAAINRGSTFGDNRTILNAENPADGDGSITTVEVWASTDITNFKVGLVYLVSGTTYKCRDSEVVGNVTSGSKNTFSGLDIDVAVGDFIGGYLPGGSTLERDLSGYAGSYYHSSDYMDPNDSTSYYLVAGDAVSLYATGETAGATYEVSVSEAFTAAEALARFRTTGLAVSENITGSEALAKVRETPKALAEALTMAEALSALYGGALGIGLPAIDRSVNTYQRFQDAPYTRVAYGNPATAPGSVTTVEAWFHTATSPNEIKVGSFSHDGSNVLTCHDSESIGEIVVGSKQTYTGLDISFETGEHIGSCGISGTTVYIEADATGRDGEWSFVGECIDPTDSEKFLFHADDGFSLHGIGIPAGQIFQAHISEDITGSEALAAVSGLLGVLAEALTASEALAVQWDIKTAISEALTVAEALGVQADLQGSVSENLAAAEALSAIATLYAAVSEALTESEAVARMVETTHVVTDTVAISETVALVRLLYRALSDNVGIADSSVANLALYLLTLKLYARALTMKTQATSLTVKLRSRDLAVKIPEVQ